ncbi:pentapeptide repeat protein [Candidatus Vecturithrix granuli]|uniref:Pentapeptide repeat protein n=1 Tax=Vecturithrix granuli TaxID=1499967 RepID=A0A081C7B0_VECG1|nr:pentapeptide repeat protein [Candidatus Vecturithrix granuli]
MANRDQLTLLKQGVPVWNAWRKEHPDENIDLQGADLGEMGLENVNLADANLRDAHLWNAHLRGANLQGAHLQGAHLRGANLQGANLRSSDLGDVNLKYANLKYAVLAGADLGGAHLRDAHLQEANLAGVDLGGSDLRDAHLWNADLQGADLRYADLRNAGLQGADLASADLRFAKLKQADLTGVNLFAAAKDQWEIDGVHCAYVFWDREGKERFPKDHDFRPGEFEELYKQLPTFEYIFEHGFTPLDAVVMARVVEAINEQYPEFKLDLVNFDKRGDPHATFTVVHQKDVETAKAHVATAYERRILELEVQKSQLMDVIKMLGSGGITIQTVGGDVTIKQAGRDIVAGSKEQRAITAGRDYFEQVQDQAQVTTDSTAQAGD